MNSSNYPLRPRHRLKITAVNGPATYQEVSGSVSGTVSPSSTRVLGPYAKEKVFEISTPGEVDVVHEEAVAVQLPEATEDELIHGRDANERGPKPTTKATTDELIHGRKK